MAEKREQFQPVALVLGAIVPGLGYWWLGEGRRFVFVLIGVTGLIAGGVLIGGIDVIDRVSDPLWFIGQALAGPVVWVLDALHQGVLKGGPAVRSVGRVNEVGTLFVVLGGMLNLMALVDCVWHAPGKRGGS